MEYCIVLTALVLPGIYLIWRIVQSAKADSRGCSSGCDHCARCRD